MRAPRVVDADDRRAIFHRHVHDLTDFVRHHAAQATAENGKILRVNINQAAVDGAVPGHHGVAGKLLLIQSKIGAVVRAQAIELDEAAAVEQDIETLARQKLSLFVLPLAALLAAAGLGLLIEIAKFIEIIRCGHQEEFLRREGKIVATESPGIITKEPSVSTEFAPQRRR
jgi:hypothetical protein